MKNKFVILTTIFIIVLSFSGFSATVIKKEDAAMYSKKSDYATFIDQNSIEQQISEGTITIESVKQEASKATTLSEDDMDRFRAVKATKSGNKYTNAWESVLEELGIPFKVKGPYPKRLSAHEKPR